ncbi:hypothetical protein G6F68_010332 [Rhizopus microsporus]|nr:hypothetical protein G6F68_010332 [Rhizopus microsporus]
MIASISRSRSRGPQHHASTTTPSSSDGRPNSTPRSSQASRAISSSGGSRARATPAGLCQALPPLASSQPSQRRKPSKRRSEAAAAGATWPRASATSTAARVVNMAGLPTKQNARAATLPVAAAPSAVNRTLTRAVFRWRQYSRRAWPASTLLLAVPVLDQATRNRDRRRHADALAIVLDIACQRRAHLVGTEPARIFQLTVHARQIILRLRTEPDHQRPRERPGLRAEVLAGGHPHLALLVHLAHHGLLEGLAGLDEAGQHRVAARRPVRLPAQQQPALVLHRHDHRRIHPRVMLGGALRAATDEAATGERHGTAAHATEAGTRVPVGHAAGIAEGGRIGHRP